MPYASAKQRAYLHVNEPKLAAKWDRKYGGGLDALSSKPKPKRRRRPRRAE